MSVLKIVIAVALVVLTAWLASAFWSSGYRFLAIVVVGAAADILMLGWWHHVMNLNRSHDAAMDSAQKK